MTAAIKLAHSHSALKMFENCPKQYRHVRIDKDVKDSMGEAALWGVRVHEELEARLRDKTPLPASSAVYEPYCAAFETTPGELLVEQEISLNQKLEPTGWWDDDAWLRAKLDVSVINGADAVIADWKTGKRRPDFSQLELFTLMAFKRYPDVHRVKTCFIWLKDKKVDHRTYTRLDAPALWNKALGRIHRVEQAAEHNNWPARPSGLCPWCPAKSICEFA